MPGRLLAIYLRPGARQPVRAVDRATATAGVGLEGDHAAGGKRQVTVLSRQAWERAAAELGTSVDPAVRRANLYVDGIELSACIGSALQIGPVVIDVVGETRPCELLEGPGRLGLCAALRPERRGGVHGTVRTGGELQVGDLCQVLASP
jgi:MOSC domain-containing protein YiiM